MANRAPIISVLGHVDHGKSSLLDSLRDSNIVRGEAGGITQAIGASIMPLEIIRKRCGALMDQLNMKLTIPGILFIDTPGHAAFTSLRKRGGNLADIAIVVIDINEGFKPQTLEAIEILRSYKTPFIIAANKADLLPGYQIHSSNFLASFSKQTEKVQTDIETKLYEIVGKMHEKFGMECERYDRVSDYTKQVAIVPCSALKKIGLEEVLMIITGMSQRFLEQNLSLNVSGPGKGVILEVKETVGLGTTLDVILYDGTLRVSDEVVIGTLSGPKEAKIKALFMPQELTDMRDKKNKYKPVKEVVAATGVKVSCSNIPEDVIAGMPIHSTKGDVAETIKSINSQIQNVTIDTDKKGIIIKADTLGSLEALTKLLKEKEVPIRKASIGNITKKDISDAESNFEEEPMHSCILGFNIKDEESTDKVKIVVRDVIYALIDEYELFVKEKEKEVEARELDKLTKPVIIEVLQNCIFRQSNPCIAGVEILKGTLKTNINLINRAGDRLTNVKSIQADKDSVNSAEKGRQVAVSLPKVVGGRQILEGEIYYSDINEEEFKKYKELKKYITEEDKEILKDIAEIKRKQNPMWGT
jgi:translation initiation factor 5B